MEDNKDLNEDKRQKNILYQKKYYADNKDKFKDKYYKEYTVKSPCTCGKMVAKCRMNRHINSKIHTASTEQKHNLLERIENLEKQLLKGEE